MTDRDPVDEPAQTGGSDAAGADPVPAATPADTSGADLDRRRFFRQFAVDVFQTAATVVGAASALQRSSVEAASALLNPPAAEAPSAVPGVGEADLALDPDARAIQARVASGAAAGYRSAFRVEGDRIVLVDQRRLPAALIEIECRTAIDVANEMRDLTVRGGPVLGQVAAAGLALSAHRVRASRPYARRAILRAAATTLVNARPTPRHVAAAVDRVMARYDAIGDLDEDGDRIADAIQAESDAIIYEALDDHSRIAGAAADQLSRPEGRPLGILTLGSTGAMGSGQFGTALGAIQTAVYRGHEVHIYVLEGRPWLDGARVASWELAQAQIPHTLVADSAAGWLLASGRIDVVLVGAERIARNGDVANDVGTYPVAVLASRHGVPFIVCSPLAAVDSAAADGSTFPLEERPADDLIRVGGLAVAPGGTSVLNPVTDMTPAALITGIATEEGFLAPNAMALAMAGVGRARRTAATSDELQLPPTADRDGTDDTLDEAPLDSAVGSEPGDPGSNGEAG